jgi:sulfite exporter TauE/SafE
MYYLKFIQYFTEGSLLGFAAGISCAVFCIPVFLGLASRNINKINTSLDMGFFLIGKFIAYMFVGIFFSIVGMHLKFISFAGLFSKLIIGGLLIYWGIKGFIESDKEKNNCSIKKFNKIIPFIAGILIGISPCPPFIAGITRILVLGNVFAGILYFLGFYVTTSLFLFPVLSTHFLKYKKELKIIASIISIAFGVMFILFSASLL